MDPSALKTHHHNDTTFPTVAIAVDAIVADKNFNVRSDRTDVTWLMGDIAKHGLIHPLVVMSTTVEGKYRLISGFRRYQAMVRLGWTHVRCTVRDDLNAQTALELNLSENLHRVEVDFFDLSDRLAQMAGQFKLVAAQLSRRIGLPAPKVQKLLTIGKQLSLEVRHAIVASHLKVSLDEIYTIARLPEPEQYAAWLDLMGAKDEVMAKLRQDLTKALGLSDEMASKGRGGKAMGESIATRVRQMCKQMDTLVRFRYQKPHEFEAQRAIVEAVLKYAMGQLEQSPLVHESARHYYQQRPELKWQRPNSESVVDVEKRPTLLGRRVLP